VSLTLSTSVPAKRHLSNGLGKVHECDRQTDRQTALWKNLQLYPVVEIACRKVAIPRLLLNNYFIANFLHSSSLKRKNENQL